MSLKTILHFKADLVFLREEYRREYSLPNYNLPLS